MKPWQLGDGDNTVSTEQLRTEFIFDSINRQLAAIGVTDQTTFDAFANYIGYSTGGTPSYQDMQVAWTPSNLKLGEALGFFTYGDIPETDLVFNQSTSLAGFDIESTTTPQSITFPNLASIDPLNTQGGSLYLISNAGLTSFDAPLLATVAGKVNIQNNNLLTSVSLAALVSVGGTLGIAGDALTSISLPSLVTCGQTTIAFSSLLTSISLPLWVPTNGTVYAFNDNALDDTSVNLILARCVANAGYVSGLIGLSGGTNSPPTGQGILDKATLNARQVGLVTTN